MAITDEIQSAEIQAPGTRGDQEAGKHGANSNQHRGTGQASSEIRSQPFSTDRNDWAWANSLGQRGQTIVGGIFERLITKTRNQIKESESQTAELKQELQELEELFKQFQEETQEVEIGLKPE